MASLAEIPGMVEYAQLSDWAEVAGRGARVMESLHKQ
jgi:hypothetical protein